jgi:hypothetical protein
MPRKSRKVYVKSPHTRVHTARDSEISRTMFEIRTKNPGIPQTQVLSMAAKAISKFGSGLFRSRRKLDSQSENFFNEFMPI